MEVVLGLDDAVESVGHRDLALGLQVEEHHGTAVRPLVGVEELRRLIPEVHRVAQPFHALAILAQRIYRVGREVSGRERTLRRP
jgi:hypothetical protein